MVAPAIAAAAGGRAPGPARGRIGLKQSLDLGDRGQPPVDARIGADHLAVEAVEEDAVAGLVGDL